MKVTISSVVLAALLGLVDAKVHLTNSDFGDIEAGSTFEITWDEAQGPVTLTLKNGDENNLDTVETITTGASGDSFVWSVDSTLPTGDYAIEISDGTDMNYSVMFPIAGTTAPSSSSSSTGVSSTVSITSSTASPTSSSESSSSSVETTTESTSSESTSAESTSTETTSSTSASSSAESTTSTSAVTRTTSSTPSPTQSDASQTTVPNANDALSMAAPIVPGLLALLGAAIL
ncbi:putative extracellular matrix protein [Rosellinia necatrix]|uniref:Putative extracellular matrix protein n=1 Tax=Rosellinia necatrix TaxID=77044 RepID=A0A1S7UKP1_ROSNE|nr:putative extracellular matrix protein [Rosellinia necatrix]